MERERVSQVPLEEISFLPQPERAVLAWRLGLGCEPQSYRAIARRLGVSVGTAWNIEKRAQKIIRHLHA